MYAPDVTQSALDRAAQSQGWPLIPHTHTQVSTATAHFDQLYDPDQQALTRPLTPDETRWISNERRLCALDYPYWLSRYARIVDWAKKDQAFSPNVAQRIILDIWADLERQGRAIMMIQLKARQLGVTTLTELAVAHRVQFWPRVNAVVASADPKKSVKMAGMIDFCWASQPWWLLPRATKIEHGMPVEYGELNSSLLIQAGNQFNGVARGQTPNVCHLSELADWEDPDLLVDAALLKAIHETPDVFVILESTALGRGNWWHDTWKQTKEDWPRGRSRLCPVFLPWFVGTDIYPTATDLRMRPIPPNWVPSDLTQRHATRAREYVLSNPALFRHLAKGNKAWQMPRAQMWYYEVERETAIKKKQLNLFLSEMPADDGEAFQSTNISVFGPETILIHREATQSPLAVYTIAGTGIPNDLVVERRLWDPTQEVVTIRASEVLKTNEVFHFIPLKFEGYSVTGSDLKLFIYEWPEADHTYGLGVDTSDGVGLDSSVIEVLRKAFPAGPDQQVAEFASPYIKALQLWPMVLAIGIFFSTFQSRLQRRPHCRIAIECRGNGETVQWELQKRGWSNFHPWKKLDNKKPMTDDKVVKLGIFTSSWYRPMMLDRILTMLEDHSLLVASPYFVNEMEALEKDENRQSLKATYGEHDDRIMALGFILDSLHVDDRSYGRSAYARGSRVFDPKDPPTPQPYAVCPVPDQARDIPNKPGHSVSIRRGPPTLGRLVGTGVRPWR